MLKWWKWHERVRACARDKSTMKYQNADIIWTWTTFQVVHPTELPWNCYWNKCVPTSGAKQSTYVCWIILDANIERVFVVDIFFCLTKSWKREKNGIVVNNCHMINYHRFAFDMIMGRAIIIIIRLNRKIPTAAAAYRIRAIVCGYLNTIRIYANNNVIHRRMSYERLVCTTKMYAKHRRQRILRFSFHRSIHIRFVCAKHVSLMAINTIQITNERDTHKIAH